MGFILIVAGAFVGGLSGSLVLNQTILSFFFAIPFTIRLRNEGVLRNTKPAQYFVTAGTISLIVFAEISFIAILIGGKEFFYGYVSGIVFIVFLTVFSSRARGETLNSAAEEYFSNPSDA